MISYFHWNPSLKLLLQSALFFSARPFEVGRVYLDHQVLDTVVPHGYDIVSTQITEPMSNMTLFADYAAKSILSLLMVV